MPYLIGLLLALGVSLFARVIKLDRDRAFYPTVMIVIALLYDLFAVLGGSTKALIVESAIGIGFILVTVLGFKFNLWLVAGALLAHGVMDVFHGHLVSNPGVPVWWPQFCSTYDIAAAACLAWLLHHAKLPAKAIL